MPTLHTPRTKEVMRANNQSRCSARRGGMARRPRQGIVGKRIAANAKHSAAVALIAAGEAVSCQAISAMATPQHPAKKAEQTARIARASVGKRASRSRLQPGAAITCHQVKSPTAKWTGLAVKNMIIGVNPVSKANQPACPMAKETRRRRHDEEFWAARSLAVMGWGLLGGEGEAMVAVVVVIGGSGLLERLIFKCVDSVAAVPGLSPGVLGIVSRGLGLGLGLGLAWGGWCWGGFKTPDPAAALRQSRSPQAQQRRYRRGNMPRRMAVANALAARARWSLT